MKENTTKGKTGAEWRKGYIEGLKLHFQKVVPENMEREILLYSYDTGVSTKTIRRYLRELVEMGMI